MRRPIFSDEFSAFELWKVNNGPIGPLNLNCQVYPFLLAGAALAAAGTGLSIAGNEQSKAEMAAVRSAYQRKQKEFQKQAETVLGRSMDTSTANQAATDMQKGVQARQSILAKIKQATQPAATPVPTTGTNGYEVSGADPVSRAATVSASSGNRWNQIVGGAQTKLASYGDWNTDQAIRHSQDTGELGVVSNKARGQAAILPGQLEAASHAGDTLSTIGQLVSALGSVGMMGGAAGLGAATPAISPATTAAGASAAASGYAPVGFWANAFANPLWKTAAFVP